MLWHWHALSSCLMLVWLCTSNAICPSECSCGLDEKGRRAVYCLLGGMVDPVPVEEMDATMEVLDISAPSHNWNALTMGPIFQRFKALQEVRIRRSGLAQIGMHTFWGVPSIKVLDLAFNNISALFDHNFRGLVNLNELRLNDNLIERLSSGVFKHLTELRVLTLERNRLEELVPRIFLKLGKLQVLKLSGNPLLELMPEVFKDVLELHTFECRNCDLSRINTQIYHLLPYLVHLDLGNNRMQFITSDEFRDLRRIRSIRLDGNQLPVVLEKTFVSQKDLQVLCLARNRLAKITNTAFLNLSNLHELDISYNKLNRVEAVVFHPLENLKKLSLSGNHFSEEVLRVVLQAVKVQELEVADVGFGEMSPGLFPEHVRALNLSGNNLTELGALPQQLVELDISRNRFRGLDEHAVFRLGQLQRVHLQDNPWSCDDCHLGALLNKTSFNVTCASPPRLQGLPFHTVRDLPECGQEGDFERDDVLVFFEENVTLVVGGLGLFLFLVACITFVVCSCLRRRVHIREIKEKREEREVFENPTAVFGEKGEISFKFPLDLTERKVSVSTIDEIKRDAHLPNGTAAGVS